VQLQQENLKLPTLWYITSGHCVNYKVRTYWLDVSCCYQAVCIGTRQTAVMAYG